jgi:hypothetical protein
MLHCLFEASYLKRIALTCPAISHYGFQKPLAPVPRILARFPKPVRRRTTDMQLDQNPLRSLLRMGPELTDVVALAQLNNES